jgi:hypothetical protein
MMTGTTRFRPNEKELNRWRRRIFFRCFRILAQNRTIRSRTYKRGKYCQKSEWNRNRLVFRQCSAYGVESFFRLLRIALYASGSSGLANESRQQTMA